MEQGHSMCKGTHQAAIATLTNWTFCSSLTSDHVGLLGVQSITSFKTLRGRVQCTLGCCQPRFKHYEGVFNVLWGVVNLGSNTTRTCSCSMYFGVLST